MRSPFSCALRVQSGLPARSRRSRDCPGAFGERIASGCRTTTNVLERPLRLTPIKSDEPGGPWQRSVASRAVRGEFRRRPSRPREGMLRQGRQFRQGKYGLRRSAPRANGRCPGYSRIAFHPSPILTAGRRKRLLSPRHFPTMAQGGGSVRGRIATAGTQGPAHLRLQAEQRGRSGMGRRLRPRLRRRRAHPPGLQPSIASSSIGPSVGRAPARRRHRGASASDRSAAAFPASGLAGGGGALTGWKSRS